MEVDKLTGHDAITEAVFENNKRLHQVTSLERLDVLFFVPPGRISPSVNMTKTTLLSPYFRELFCEKQKLSKNYENRIKGVKN